MYVHLGICQWPLGRGRVRSCMMVCMTVDEEGWSYSLVFFCNAQKLLQVWPHGRAVVADARCTCGEMAVQDVEHHPCRV